MKNKKLAYLGGGVVILIITVVYLYAKQSYRSETKAVKTNAYAVKPAPEKPLTLAAAKLPKKTQDVIVRKPASHPCKPKAIVKNNPAPHPADIVAPVAKATPVKQVASTAKSHLFSTEYLEMQVFYIPCNKDTSVVAKEGMTVSIPAQAFTDRSGKLVTGRVKLEIKEAFTPTDIVFANLVTKKGKDLLESGGMYYLNASSNDENLQVAPGKQLTVKVPTPQKEDGMELYKGLQTESGLDWTEPVAMNGNNMELALTKKEKREVVNTMNMDPAVDKEVKKEQQQERALFKGKKSGKTNRNDSLGWINPEVNRFLVDGQLSYLMKTNRMGWANIDRLYHDPRSRQVNFVTTVENNKDYDNVYITMIFKSRRIYLPGYKKGDGTYSFTHGDYEEPVLPVGEKALVMVSAYKNNEHYFDLQEVLIDDVMKVSMVPHVQKEEDIKAQINKSL